MKMNKTDKAIVAFLVSLGIFTAMQAKTYLTKLSTSQKKELSLIKELSVKNVLVCENADKPVEIPVPKNV